MTLTDVSLYVRVDGRTTRVGRVKKGVSFDLINNKPGPEIAVDLGVPKAEVYAFIKQPELQASCDPD